MVATTISLKAVSPEKEKKGREKVEIFNFKADAADGARKNIFKAACPSFETFEPLDKEEHIFSWSPPTSPN